MLGITQWQARVCHPIPNLKVAVGGRKCTVLRACVGGGPRDSRAAGQGKTKRREGEEERHRADTVQVPYPE